MRFANVHKFSVYAVAVLGLLALASGGALQGPIGVLVALGVIASWWAEGKWIESRSYARAQTAVLVAVLCVQLARVLLTAHGLLDAIVEFTALLQVSRLAYRRSATEYQQVTAIALGQLIAATVLGAGLSYAICFLGFVITLPWALTLGHLRREIEGNYLADARAGRAGIPIDVARILRSRRVVGPSLLVGSSLLSVPIFALTAVLFVLFPRIGFGMFSLRPSRGTATAGLGDQVDLSGHGTIRDDPTIVLRIEPPNLPQNPPMQRAFRLRGAAFDTYHGRTWTRQSTARIPVLRNGAEYNLHRTRGDFSLRQQGYRITLDGLDPPVLLLPPGTVRVRVEPRIEAGYPRYPELTRDAANEIRYAAQDDLGLVYTAFVPTAIDDDGGLQTADRTPLDESARQRYLQLPAVSQEFISLSQQLTSGYDRAVDKARSVARYLRNYRYTLTVESGAAERPIEHFLFRSRAGHCEYFSTAMTLLLRASGVPTRNVTGFLGGSFNRYGRFYAIRQGDAHSWVEVYDEQLGWLTFDPTPPTREPAIARKGLVVEIDAVIEAMRTRWRRYIVGFDLRTQLQLFQRAARWMNLGGRRSPSTGQRGVNRIQSASTLRSSRRATGMATIVLLALASVATAWWWRSRARRKSPETSRAARDAMQLARAFDEAVARRGFPRAPYRSLVAHAEALVAQKIPIGPLALKVAHRWAAARFGPQPLQKEELASLVRALDAFVDSTPLDPSGTQAGSITS